MANRSSCGDVRSTQSSHTPIAACGPVGLYDDRRRRRLCHLPSERTWRQADRCSHVTGGRNRNRNNSPGKSPLLRDVTMFHFRSLSCGVRWLLVVLLVTVGCLVTATSGNYRQSVYLFITLRNIYTYVFERHFIINISFISLNLKCAN